MMTAGVRPGAARWIVAAAAAVLALAGCTGADGESANGPNTAGSTTAATTAPSTAPSTAQPTAQSTAKPSVPSTASRPPSATTSRTTAAPTTAVPTTVVPTTAAPTTAKPETRDGPCPYLDAEFVKDTIGQHLGRVTHTTATPSTCTFYRSDGDWGATVAPTYLASANDAARQAVTIPGPDAQPVDLPTGGAVAIIKDGAILATSRDTLLLVVKINQQSPLEATEIAKQALSAL